MVITINSFRIKGFPEKVGKELDIPDMAELLLMPFFDSVSIDDFYKHGNDFQKYLVDNTPVVGKGRAGVIFTVQLLYPGLAALNRRSKYKQEWHMDYDVSKSEEESVRFTHLLQSGCSECFTEFNTDEFNINIEEDFFESLSINDKKKYGTLAVNTYLNENEKQLPLKGKQIEANKIHTFDSHVHRIILPTRPQFRLIYRVWETDEREELSSVYNGGMTYDSSAGKDVDNVVNIIRHNNEIVLKYNK